MARRIVHKLKLLLTLVLIVVMTTPATIIAAPFDEGVIWADLPVIDPPEIDLSQYPEFAEIAAMHRSMPESMEAFNALTVE